MTVPSRRLRAGLAVALPVAVVATTFFAANGSASPRLPSVITTSTTVPDTTTSVPDTTTTTVPDTTTTTVPPTTTTTTLPTTTTTTTTSPAARPSAPTSLDASRGGRSSVLTWSPPFGDVGPPVTGYVVIRSNPGSSTWTVLSSSIAANTWTYTATGLTPGATYWYRVAAVNAAGQGPWSVSASARTYALPSVPQNVLVNASGAGRLTVSWQPPLSLDGESLLSYTVARSVPGTTSWVSTVVNGPFHQGSSRVSLNVAGLQPGARYYFRVAATTSAGTGPASPSVYGTPWSLASAPRSVVASARSGAAVISWTAPASTGGAPIRDWTIIHSVPGSTSWATVDGALTGAGTRSVTVNGLRPGARYYFRVAAVTAAGTGAWSPSTAVVPASIGLTTTLRASRTSARPGDEIVYTMTVTNTSPWAAQQVTAALSLPSAAGYVSASGMPPGPVDGYSYWTGPRAVVFHDSSLPAGATLNLTVRVRVFGVVTGTPLRAEFRTSLGSTGLSVTRAVSVSAVAGPRVTPSAPRNVRIVVGSGNVAMITWDGVASPGSSYVRRYYVQRAASLAGPWTTMAGPLPNEVDRYQFGDVRAPGQRFYYRITAANDAGYGTFSTPVRA